MGIFDFLKKKSVQKEKTAQKTPNILTGKGLVDYIYSNLENPTHENLLKALDRIAKPDDDLTHLTKEGELPWGWHSHNKELTAKIQGEYSYFLNMWLDARKKSPKEQYPALKSFVLYLEDLEKQCKSKGECFEFWFYEILTTKDYITQRKTELDELTANLDTLQKEYEAKHNK